MFKTPVPLSGLSRLALCLAALAMSPHHASGGGQHLPLTQPAYHAPAALLEHKAIFRDEVRQIADTPVWSLIDHGVNMVLVEGPEGLILFDTGLHQEYAEKALDRIRAISDKPIVAIIYSHHHPDHINGAGFFVEPQDVASGKVPVIAAHNLIGEMSSELVMNAPIMALRSSYMFGFGLQGQAGKDNYVGCCGELKKNATAPIPTAFIPPTVLVHDALNLELGGVEFELFFTGGEAGSHIAAYLPEHGVLLAGDEIQGPTFPNLHSLRGTRMRDANAWVRAMDRMRERAPEHLVPNHGHPIHGREEVARILTLYRDAIQYTHDQTIRYINKGLVHDELAHALPALPEYLHEEPWTGEHYGNVPTAARSYYAGYISWFSGDATELMPTPRDEFARRMVTLLGGRERVAELATGALQDDDPQFAAELATWLIRSDRDDRHARNIKATAFRTLGYQQTNMNWRNFYLMGAMDLAGEVNLRNFTGQLDNPDNLARLPLAVMLDALRYRVDAEKAGDTRLILGLRFPGAEPVAVELRNSIVQIHQGTGLPQANGTLTLDARTFADLMLGKRSPDEAIQQGSAEVAGDRRAVAQFFTLLDYDIAPQSLLY